MTATPDYDAEPDTPEFDMHGDDTPMTAEARPEAYTGPDEELLQEHWDDARSDEDGDDHDAVLDPDYSSMTDPDDDDDGETA